MMLNVSTRLCNTYAERTEIYSNIVTTSITYFTILSILNGGLPIYRVVL